MEWLLCQLALQKRVQTGHWVAWHLDQIFDEMQHTLAQCVPAAVGTIIMAKNSGMVQEQ